MTNSPITHLRSASFVSPDVAASASFFAGPWSLTDAGADGDVRYFGSEGSADPYILRVRAGDAPSLELISFGAADAAAVDTLAAELASAGTRIVSEPAPLETPGGGYGFRFFDPDGRLTEVASDVEQTTAREFGPGEAVPSRLSHIVLNSADADGLRAFYEQHLGFRLSDKIGEFFYFLRCQTDHHTIGITRGPAAALNHLSFEVRGIDEFMRATGRVLRSGGTLLWGPGRHTAGDNTFAYFDDPSGLVVEYSSSLEQILDEDAWEPHEYTMADADQWGTAGFPSQEFIAKGHDPDPSLDVVAPV